LIWLCVFLHRHTLILHPVIKKINSYGRKEIRERNPYVYDFDKLPASEWYVCHIRLPQVPHDIALVCSYHPSSVKYWYNDLEKLKGYMQQVLQK